MKRTGTRPRAVAAALGRGFNQGTGPGILGYKRCYKNTPIHTPVHTPSNARVDPGEPQLSEPFHGR